MLDPIPIPVNMQNTFVIPVSLSDIHNEPSNHLVITAKSLYLLNTNRKQKRCNRKHQ